jgi:hypothetical protein
MAAMEVNEILNGLDYQELMDDAFLAPLVEPIDDTIEGAVDGPFVGIAHVLEEQEQEQDPEQKEPAVFDYFGHFDGIAPTDNVIVTEKTDAKLEVKTIQVRKNYLQTQVALIPCRGGHASGYFVRINGLILPAHALLSATHIRTATDVGFMPQFNYQFRADVDTLNSVEIMANGIAYMVNNCSIDMMAEIIAAVSRHLNDAKK